MSESDMDEDEYQEYIAELGRYLLRGPTTALITTKLRLLDVEDVEHMSLQECCTNLDDWKDTYNDLKVARVHTSACFLDSEDVYKNRYQQLELHMNINQVFEDILKLIKLLDKRKKSFGLVLKGKFGTNVQSLLSEFKYTAKEFDVKDLNQAQVDLHYLKGDITSKKDVLLRFFDAKNELLIILL